MSKKNWAITQPGSSLWIVSSSLHSCVYIKMLLPWHFVFVIHCPHTFCCQGPHGLLCELLNHRALFDVAISHIPCLLPMMFSERDCRINGVQVSLCSVPSPYFHFLLLETTTLLVTVLWPDVALPSAKCQKLIHHLFTGIMHSNIVSVTAFCEVLSDVCSWTQKLILYRMLLIAAATFWIDIL